MLVACWSVKGGSGTTVVAAALGVLLGRAAPAGVLVVDLGGDVPAVLGLPEPAGPGAYDWLDAPDDVPVERLGQLEVEVAPGLHLLPAGGASSVPRATPMPVRGIAGGDAAPERARAFARHLAAERRPVVVDCGSVPGEAGRAVAGLATTSLLVIRPCYLALRRAVTCPLRPTGVVLVREPGRSMGRADVEDVLGFPVRAELELDEAVARSVDAGLLATRLPRSLERNLRHAA